MRRLPSGQATAAAEPSAAAVLLWGRIPFRNIYAKAETQCEEKLKALSRKMKREITQAWERARAGR